MKVPRTKSSKKRTYKKRASKPKVSLAVKQYVKRTIAVDQENKCINTAVGANFGSISHNATLNMYPILPYTGYSTISQGVLSNNRIGNEVKIRKVMLNYVLRPNQYDLTTNPTPAPQEVMLCLGYVKQTKGFIPSAVDVGFLFQNGSSALAPQGTLSDLISDFNKDYWTIKKSWRHKIGYANASGAGANSGAQFYANNDFKFNAVKKMDVTKFCPKTLKFNDSNNSVQGNNLFFFFQSVRADGFLNTSTIAPCRIDYWISLQYEDA